MSYCMGSTVQDLTDDDPGVPMNCPWCGVLLTYVGSARRTEGDTSVVHVYDCENDGRLYMIPDEGFSRRRPRGWFPRGH